MKVEVEKRALGLLQAGLSVPYAERNAWLQQQCGDNQELTARVRELFASADNATDLLQTGGAGSQIQSTHIPAKIGAYRIIEQIGAGGMGSVYRAERADGNFTKTVAIKLLSTGEFSSNMQARFANERQILAAMQHPNVAQLIDGGIQDGFSYIVMEHINGKAFTYDASRLLRTTLKIFTKVCDAVRHAHNQLVLHRDIKPDNVLLATFDEPKLLDFGIAKLDQTLATEQLVELTGITPAPLTLNYSSPERLRGDTATIACDIYSLGVYLHELVKGKRPYDLRGLTLPEAQKTLALATEQQQAKVAANPNDLDIIIATCMHPDTTRRYASAAALSEDIERWLQQQPIAARGDDWRYLAGRFARRYRGALAGATLSLTLLMGALGYSIWQTERAQTARGQSQAIASFLESTMLAPDPFSGNALGPDSTLLELMRSAGTQLEWEFAEQPEIRIRLAQLLSRVYMSMNLPQESRKLLDEARESMTKSGIDDDFLKLLDSALDLRTSIALGSYEDAKQSCTRGLEQAKNTRLDESQVTETRLALLISCANVYANSGQIKQAPQLLDQASVLLETKSQYISQQELPLAYSELANAYAAFSNIKAFGTITDRGIAAAEDMGEAGLASLARLYLMKSLPPNQVGDNAESLRYTTLALATAERSTLSRNGVNFAFIQLYHADRLIDVGDTDAAEAVFAPARKILYGGTPEASEHRSLAHFTDYKLAFKNKDFPRAEEHLIQSRQIRMDAGETQTQWLAATDHALGNVYIEMKRFEEAEALILNAYNFYRDLLGEDHERVQVYLNSLNRARQSK